MSRTIYSLFSAHLFNQLKFWTQIQLIWFMNHVHESIIESSFKLFTSWLESLSALSLMHWCEELAYVISLLFAIHCDLFCDFSGLFSFVVQARWCCLPILSLIMMLLLWLWGLMIQCKTLLVLRWWTLCLPLPLMTMIWASGFFSLLEGLHQWRA
jgi:hypothetical protein